MRFLLSALASLGIVAVAPPDSFAQSHARIFGVEFGTPVSALPVDEWVDPACGTDGGPPSLRLASFEDFARCRPEEDTGLREVWFIYDDEWEYVARAWRDEGEISRYSANVFFRQPIVTSLLIDDAGLVQGYRVVTDPRAPVAVRQEAHSLFAVLKGVVNDAPWQCVDIPPGAAESPANGGFLKTDCVMVAEDRFATLQGRLLRKPGQDFFDVPPDAYFESLTRLDVYARDAVTDAACCRAFLRP